MLLAWSWLRICRCHLPYSSPKALDLTVQSRQAILPACASPRNWGKAKRPLNRSLSPSAQVRRARYRYNRSSAPTLGPACFRRRNAMFRADSVAAVRSEERRVGKEYRSRWSPYHYKKKKTRCLPYTAAARKLRRTRGMQECAAVSHFYGRG